MAYSEEVEKLAETLKNSGLAASMKDALERAQAMVGEKEDKKEVEERAVAKEKPVEKKMDAGQTTLGNIEEPEINRIKVLSPTPRALRKEFPNPSSKAREKPEDSNYPSGMKEVVEEPPEAQEELKKEEVFTDKEKEEPQNKDKPQQKKIDLSEVFNVNK